MVFCLPCSLEASPGKWLCGHQVTWGETRSGSWGTRSVLHLFPHSESPVNPIFLELVHLACWQCLENENVGFTVTVLSSGWGGEQACPVELKDQPGEVDALSSPRVGWEVTGPRTSQNTRPSQKVRSWENPETELVQTRTWWPATKLSETVIWLCGPESGSLAKGQEGPGRQP